MIDLIDKQLYDWAKGVVEKVDPGVQPSFAAPTDTEGELAVSLYLLEIVDDPRREHTGVPKLQPSLRYLVTTRAGEPKSAHGLLGMLFYAALDNKDYEVELDPVDTELWSAFGIAPRPAFILRVPLPHKWTLPELPLVTQPGFPNAGPLATLYGVVLGPGDIPLAGARVEMPDLNRSATTGRNGRFTLTGVRAAPAPKTLLITARGREAQATTTDTGSEDDPVKFPFDIRVTLFGKVVKPDKTPLTQAEVQIPGLQSLAKTDDQGLFTLPDVPAAPVARQLAIRSNGQQQLVSVTGTGWAANPVEIIFNPDALNKKEA